MGDKGTIALALREKFGFSFLLWVWSKECPSTLLVFNIKRS